jgi:hypothetical protein
MLAIIRRVAVRHNHQFGCNTESMVAELVLDSDRH